MSCSFTREAGFDLGSSFPSVHTVIKASMAAVLALSASSSGCATLLVGTHQDVSLVSDPPRATAHVAGAGEVRTPGVLSVERRKQNRVEFTAEGYENLEVTIERKVNPLVLGNIFFLPALIADFLAGGAYTLESEVRVEMEPSRSKGKGEDLPTRR